MSERDDQPQAPGQVRGLEAPAQRAWSDRVGAVGAIAASIAHEINNPLAFVRSNLEFVSRELRGLLGEAPGQQGAELLEAMKDTIDGVDRVAATVASLQLFALEDRGGVEQTDPRRAVEAAVKVAWPQISRRASFTQSVGALPMVYANEARLVQVLLKVLTDAAESIPLGKPGGNEISLRASFDPEQNEVTLEVSDTGVGMLPHEAARAFDPAAKHARGRGVLGLPLCYRLITSMGGGMFLESSVRFGSTVRLVLPAA
ncbi:MAG: HAMP domain-containing histidine kinase [Myxococcaceae bacterium]|nr:HAMP domain-containing histidine kinase [Myxococcaceae bacterium]